MIKSRSETKSDIGNLIDAYRGFRRGKAAEILAGREPANHGVLNILRPELSGFVERAKEIMARPDFTAKDVTADEREDIIAIAEEMATAHDELVALTDPDTVFRSLPPNHKAAAVEHHRADKGKTDLLLARITGELRKQKAPPAAAPPTTGNGNGKPK